MNKELTLIYNESILKRFHAQNITENLAKTVATSTERYELNFDRALRFTAGFRD